MDSITFEQYVQNWDQINHRRVQRHLAPIPYPHCACSVCLDRPVAPAQWTTCGHAVCADCLSQLHNFKCPVCRSSLETQLPTDVGQSIQQRIQKASKDAVVKDTTVASYIGMYPWVNLECIYSLLELLDDPEVLLFLHPTQLESVLDRLVFLNK